MGFDAKELGTIIATGRATGASPEQLQDLNAEYKLSQTGEKYDNVLKLYEEGNFAEGDKILTINNMTPTDSTNKAKMRGITTKLDTASDYDTLMDVYNKATPAQQQMLNQNPAFKQQADDLKYDKDKGRFLTWLSDGGKQEVTDIVSKMNSGLITIPEGRAEFDQSIKSLGVVGDKEANRIWDLAKSLIETNADNAVKEAIASARSKKIGAGKSIELPDYQKELDNRISDIQSVIQHLNGKIADKKSNYSQEQLTDFKDQLKNATTSLAVWKERRTNAVTDFQEGVRSIGEVEKSSEQQASEMGFREGEEDIKKARVLPWLEQADKAKPTMVSLTENPKYSQVKYGEVNGAPVMIVWGYTPTGEPTKEPIGAVTYEEGSRSPKRSNATEFEIIKRKLAGGGEFLSLDEIEAKKVAELEQKKADKEPLKVQPTQALGALESMYRGQYQ
jgi:hypothetical protein